MEVINIMHILAGTIWVGGALFMNLIFIPALKSVNFSESGMVMKKVSNRFTLFAWPSVGILIITGFLKLPNTGIIGDISNHYNVILNIKLILVTIMIAMGFYLTVILGMRIKEFSENPDLINLEVLKKLQKTMSFVSLTITVLGVIVLGLISTV